MAEFTAERPFGRRLVEPPRFEDETNFVERRRHGEIPHPLQRQRHPVRLLLRRSGPTFVELRHPVALQIDEPGMPSGNDSHGPVPGSFGLDFDIEFLGNALLETD